MRHSSRYYILIVFAPLAVLACGNVLLNFWIDPLKSIHLKYHPLSTRTYSLQALLEELERPSASEPDTDVILLGTSRTRKGIDASVVPKTVNLGINGANDNMIDNLLVGLLKTSTRPHVYFVDTMGGRRGKLEGKTLRYLLAGGTTKLSLRHIAKQIRRRSISDADSSSRSISTEPAKKNRGGNPRGLHFLRSRLTAHPYTLAVIESRVQRITEISVPHNALVVYYDGPFPPVTLSDPLIFDALRERSHLWRQVVAEHNGVQPSERDVFSSSEEHPRVTIAYLSYATPAEWGEPDAPEVWSEENWLDALHFNSTVGKVLLGRLMTDAATGSN